MRVWVWVWPGAHVPGGSAISLRGALLAAPPPARAPPAAIRPRRDDTAVLVTPCRTRCAQRGPGERAAASSPDKRRTDLTAAFPLPFFSLMLVGWGGNNGTTVTAGVLANKL